MTATIVDPASLDAAAPDTVELFTWPEEYPFPACNAIEWPDVSDAPDPHPPASRAAEVDASLVASLEKRIHEESRRSFEAGRQQGIAEGRNIEREAQPDEAEELADRLAALVTSAASDRARYFEAVEQEVVRLALAIAARILRREAQIDPLLLLGAVRVAMGQLAASTRVRLRVPNSDLQLWTDAVALLPSHDLAVEVLPGEGLRLGECMLETELGTADLGVRGQLGEIERGFFDRPSAVTPEPMRPQP